MKNFAFARLACCVGMSLASAAGWAQQPAPDPMAVLPQWAQEKLVAARADPKLHEQAYKQGAKLATFCANCHGTAGQSVKPDVPNLAGQNLVYVLNQLNKFHDGRRKGAFFMEGLVKAMTNEERFAVAVYYTSQQPPKPQPVSDAALGAKGKTVYDQGCKKCHGDNGAGNEKNSRLAGQQPEYLDKTIRRYRDNVTRADEKMLKATRDLSEGDIRALVAYIGAMR